MKQSYMLLLLLLPLMQSQVIFVSPSTACTCQQFFTQNSCNDYTLGQCYWNANQQSCKEASCPNIASQQECLVAKLRCYWNGNSCATFNKCTQLSSEQGLICPQQNVSCYGTGTSQCQSISLLSKCNAYGIGACGQQGGYAGSDGICYWNAQNVNCQVATSCSQISSEEVCGKFLQNACYWDYGNNSCQQQSCQNLVNCTFVIQNLNPDQVTPCYKNGLNCIYATNQLFVDEQQCQTNTLLNYRWLPNNNSQSGVCVSCQQQLILPTNKCSCEQILFEQDCNQSQYCKWNQNQCIEVACQNINNQYQCSTNNYCYWNSSVQQCSNLTTCYQIQANNSFQCLASSVNCPNYNFGSCTNFSYSCADYSQQVCNGQYSSEGFCYYNDVTSKCTALKQCSNIQNVNLCNQLTKLCQWNTKQSQCQQLTCSDITSQLRCTSVLTSLSSTNLQICYWNGQSCQNSQNVLILPEDQCAVNSHYTYFYTGSKCVKCIQLPIHIPNQCVCSQLYYMFDCLQNPNCQYVDFNCQQLQCYQISNQDICASNKQCQWSEYGCSDFKSCLSILGKTSKECVAQTVNCPSSNGQNCINKYNLTECQSNETSSQCFNQIGSDGFCIWDSTTETCEVLSKCTQITNSKNCGIYEYACYWALDSCKASSCSAFLTSGQCKYYYSTINSLTPIACQWNSTLSACQQVGSSFLQLSSQSCYLNTGYTSRWSQYNATDGACVSCKSKYSPNPFRCDCVQLISELNCHQNEFCFWSQLSGTCEEQQCTSFTENVCIINPKCQWTNSGCVAFTSCSQIKGKTMDECLGQSLYCPYNQTKKSCASLINLQTCDEITNSSDCNAFQGQFGFQKCSWQYETQRCFLVTHCYQLNTYQCENYSLSCTLQNGYYCTQKQCSNFTTKHQCTYVVDYDNENFIQSCQWINGTCQNSIGQIAKDEESCYANSNGTSRWTSNQKGSGFCAPCNLPPVTTKYNNRCSCSQFLNQNECIYPFCSWNSIYCQDNDCNNINSQFACAQLKWCYWSIQQQQCKSISTQLQFCQTLKGNSSLECLSQSGNCPVSLNGICQDRAHLQTCSSMKAQETCSNSIGQEGYCTYENQSCKVIETCSQIKIQAYCLSLQHICNWDSENNLCQQAFCSDYTTKEKCQFIYQSINNLTIQICEWNLQAECVNASYLTLANKTKSTCFLMSANTYHWSNASEDGYCVTCSLNQIQYPDTCSCSELSEHECTIAAPRCRLNESNSCVQATCTQLLNSPTCSQMKDCMWYQGNCVQFTSCSSLKGQSALDCWAQSKMCPGVLNGICQQQSELKDCNSFTTTATCPLGMPSKNGLCFWNGTQCAQIVNCESITNVTQCDALNKMCSWSLYFNKCTPYKCQDITEQDLCNYVIVNFKNPYVEMCQWQNGHCMPFTGKYYRYDEQTCYENSGHTYKWISDDSHGSRCQQCFETILISVLAIYLIGF